MQEGLRFLFFIAHLGILSQWIIKCCYCQQFYYCSSSKHLDLFYLHFHIFSYKYTHPIKIRQRKQDITLLFPWSTVMISEFNPLFKLDTNSPTTEDRRLLVHNSWYIVGLYEDCGWTEAKTFDYLTLHFWSWKNPQEQRQQVLFPKGDWKQV